MELRKNTGYKCIKTEFKWVTKNIDGIKLKGIT